MQQLIVEVHLEVNTDILLLRLHLYVNTELSLVIGFFNIAVVVLLFKLGIQIVFSRLHMCQY